MKDINSYLTEAIAALRDDVVETVSNVEPDGLRLVESYKNYLTSLHQYSLNLLAEHGTNATKVEYIIPHTVVNIKNNTGDMELIEEKVKEMLGSGMLRVGSKTNIVKSIKSVFTGEVAIGTRKACFEVKFEDVGLPLIFKTPAVCVYWLVMTLTCGQGEDASTVSIKVLYPTKEKTYTALESFANAINERSSNEN